MANLIGPNNDWQQWASKWMPELQTGKGQLPPLESGKQGAGELGSTARFSTQAEKLQYISQTYFSNGAISSSKIRDLSFSLYEQGLITGDEFRRVTGEPLPKAGLITDSIQFLSKFIQSESIDGDSEGAAELNNALMVLQRVDEVPTSSSIADERSSAVYIREYRDLLVETESDEYLITGFDQLVSVFDAILDVRSSDGAV